MLRWSALVSIAEPAQVALALVAAHVAARALLPAIMRFVPLARTDGLSAQAGRPPLISVVVAIVIAAATLAATLAAAAAVLAILLVGIAGVLVSWCAMRQIGGQTGDVLGAAEQIGETLVLLTAASLLLQASHA
jgi:adenosylcobinamide-GDP ribazoletransferase